MPIIILLVIAAILVSLYIGMKLKNSRTFSDVVDEITEEHDLAEPKTGEVIKGIDEAEKSLKDRSKKQDVEMKQMAKDNKQIGDYLDKQGKGK